MTDKERDFYNGCDSFKDYANIDEYKADIRRWLTLSSWHYSEADAGRIIEQNKAYIERAYEAKEPAGDAAAEVGYCCG